MKTPSPERLPNCLPLNKTIPSNVSSTVYPVNRRPPEHLPSRLPLKMPSARTSPIVCEPKCPQNSLRFEPIFETFPARITVPKTFPKSYPPGNTVPPIVSSYKCAVPSTPPKVSQPICCNVCSATSRLGAGDAARPPMSGRPTGGCDVSERLRSDQQNSRIWGATMFPK